MLYGESRGLPRFWDVRRGCENRPESKASGAKDLSGNSPVVIPIIQSPPEKAFKCIGKPTRKRRAQGQQAAASGAFLVFNHQCFLPSMERKCTRYVPGILLCRLWKILLSSIKGCGWSAVAFYDSKGRQHFRLSSLDCGAAQPGEAVNGGPVHLDRWLARLGLLFSKDTKCHNREIHTQKRQPLP